MIKQARWAVTGSAAIGMIVGMLGAGGTAAADWPQYRGVGRDGQSAERGIARAWPESGPKVVWRRPLGPGFSEVVAVGERLFTMYAADGREWLAAFDRKDGRELWRADAGELFQNEFGDGPRATPTVRDGTVFALGSRGKLVAAAADSGEIRWQVDLGESFGSSVPRFGWSPSPLVEGDLVLLEAGGGEGARFVALDGASGAVRWKSLDGGPGYASPIAVTIGDGRQLIWATGEAIVALSPKGAELWRHAWPPGTIAMPLFLPPDRVFVSAPDDVGAAVLRVGASGVTEVWRGRSMRNHFSSSVALGEHVYGFDNASLKCVDAAKGDTRWIKRGLGKGSLIAADGLLLVLGDQGTLVLLEATPEGYVEHGRIQAFESKTWTAPSLSNGRIYLRDLAEMIAVEAGS